MFGLFIISGIFGVIGGLVSSQLKKKFAKYAQMPTSSGLSGREVAQKMLEYYNIYDVQITQGRGRLTDHYNPTTKTVSLSPEVYGGRSVSAAAVAAHEVGHAVQHAESYAMLQFRSAIVPIVNISSKFQSIFFGVGVYFAAAMNSPIVLILAIAAFAVTTLFSVVTLPVEYDASNRALAWLESSNITRGAEHEGAKDALKWAARTYVVGALAAVAQLLYLVTIFLGSRD
ncbi:MAG: zinc metallopeptidase [Bacteroidota bacterium]